jgi:chemotaxis protein MotB
MSAHDEHGAAVADTRTLEQKPHGDKTAHAPQKGADAHGAKPHGSGEHGGGKDGHGGAHGGGHKKHDHDHPPGTPPWLISFGDMMTLFLCFFIMLVTMAKTQDAGLIAKGLGPFVASLEMSGNDGALHGGRMLEGVNRYRTRFGLEPLTEQEWETGIEAPHDPADIESLVKDSLRSSFSLDQPLIATFAADSADLTDDARHYLDLLATSLRPGQGQVLVLEGHADDADKRFDDDNTLLALRRAYAVAQYFIEEHGFVSIRVEPRAFARDVVRAGSSARGVDARVVQPIENEEQQ